MEKQKKDARAELAEKSIAKLQALNNRFGSSGFSEKLLEDYVNELASYTPLEDKEEADG